MPRWCEQDTLKLIKLYKSYDFLWNKTADLYTNTFARMQAYEDIVNKMELPGLTVRDVRCKIKNIRTTYYQELRKLIVCKAENRVYKPTRWFMAFRNIMEILIKATSSENPQHSQTLRDAYANEEYEAQKELQTIDSILVKEEPTSDSDVSEVSIKLEIVDEMDNLGDNVMPPAKNDFQEPVVKKRKITNEQEKPSDDSGEGDGTAKTVDEFQMFANNIAEQLRQLPLKRALEMQIDMQKMLAKERTEILVKQEKTSEDGSS